MRILRPGWALCSRRATRRPRWPATAAHIRPAAPAPRTRTSKRRNPDGAPSTGSGIAPFSLRRTALNDHPREKTSFGRIARYTCVPDFFYQEERLMSAVVTNPIVPPFTRETAMAKVRAAEDAWNTRDPQRVSLAYSIDSRWRNRSEFIHGRRSEE